MNKQEYLEFHKNFCNKMYEITEIKNSDYTANSTSPFSNFEKAELLGICTNEAGILVRITDKISRIVSYLNKGELLVKDESVTDSILDAANYLILLAGYIESKKNSITEPTILNVLDLTILALLEEEGKYEYQLIAEINNGYDDYSYRTIVHSLDKLLQLNKIKVNDNYYSLVTN